MLDTSLTQKVIMHNPPLHPVVALPGNRYEVASFSVRGRSYIVDCRSGVPVCKCPAWRSSTGCKHTEAVMLQWDALQAEISAQYAAERAERRASRIARGITYDGVMQDLTRALVAEGRIDARGQSSTEATVIPPPVKGPAAA
jgi:hypothetical protein